MTALDVYALVTCLFVGLLVAALAHPMTGRFVRKQVGFVGSLMAVWAGLLALGVLFRARKSKKANVPLSQNPRQVEVVRGVTAQREVRIVRAAAEDNREEVRDRLADAIARRERAEREME